MITIGPHTLFNQNIDRLDFAPAMNGRKARAMYVDPPWGPGTMKYWATLAHKQAGLSLENISFDALLARIAAIIEVHVHGHVFIEMGVKWIAQLEDAMSSVLLDVVVEPIQYKSGNKLVPAALLHGRTRGSMTAIDSTDLRPLRGPHLTDAAIAKVAIPGEYVIDPCCGMGYTASAALNHKMHFVGNELNPSRLRKTEDRIRTISGWE